ncbi:MAG TPA: FCD domain-containing protein, partial [Steroidobacteraceae bacterium]|nr:FCD domain-containing protein [Steroidobacteraceae bacterium]
AARGEDDPLASDIAFHVAVLRASGNRFYAQLEELIDTALRISIRLTNQFKGVALGDVADHKKVLDAIEARDPVRARTAMEAIIREVMDLITTAGRKSKALGSNRALASRKTA